jgi:Cu(I)/Ag(I) efflux system membrane fusion protein/cobalt-zinc-cadmium efflux system membrane fusion protein
VSSANFLIDSEAQLQSVLGAYSSASQPSVAPASAANPQSIQIAFSSAPSPPHKGENTIEVRLSGPDGKPVSGAQVNVTFSMPAMPAMGMGAMRAAASLADKGQGLYAGALQLESGGTWQVTITATRNSQTIATKQISVSATGGM